MEDLFAALENGIFYALIFMMALNIMFFIYGKIKKAEVSPFGMLWTGGVILFHLFFIKVATSGEVSVREGFSPEATLYFFFFLFTLAAYALTLATIDDAIIGAASDCSRYLKLRNVINHVMGVFVLLLGVYMLLRIGQDEDAKRNGFIKFTAIMTLLIGCLMIMTALKRIFLRISVSQAERNAVGRMEMDGDWQKGITIPIFQKLMNYEEKNRIFALIILAVVWLMGEYFLFGFIKELFFVLPASLVLTLVLGLSGYASWRTPKLLSEGRFCWKYARITGQYSTTERERYSSGGSVRTVETTHRNVSFDNGETYEVDEESYRRYSVGAEVFIVRLENLRADGALGDLPSQLSQYDNKCQLYG